MLVLMTSKLHPIPHTNMQTLAPIIRIRVTNSQYELWAAMADLPIPQLAQDFPATRHIMPSFQHTPLSLGPICDANCKVLFSQEDITVFLPDGTSILTCQYDTSGSCPWHSAFHPWANQSLPTQPDITEASCSASCAYDLHSIEDLVCYVHAAAGLPVKSTWLKAIKAGNFATWSSLSNSNASNINQNLLKLKVHMVQTKQGAHFTMNKTTKPAPTLAVGAEMPEEPKESLLCIQSNVLHICKEPINKHYTGDCGCFPTCYFSGN